MYHLQAWFRWGSGTRSHCPTWQMHRTPQWPTCCRMCTMWSRSRSSCTGKTCTHTHAQKHSCTTWFGCAPTVCLIFFSHDLIYTHALLVSWHPLPAGRCYFASVPLCAWDQKQPYYSHTTIWPFSGNGENPFEYRKLLHLMTPGNHRGWLICQFSR